MGYLLISTVLEAHEIKGWLRVPATILTAELHTNSDSDGSTYAAKATYSYEVNGRKYIKDRVSLHSGADNLGNFHHDAYALLSRHKESGEPFLAYVDPEDPDNSILIPDLRFGMLLMYAAFGAVFGGAGFGIFAAVLGVKHGEKKLWRFSVQYPEQPWMHREDWRQSKVTTSAGTTALTMTIVALVVTGFTAPLLYLIPEEIFKKGNYWVTLALIFPLIGGAILWGAIRSIIRWRKFGSATLELHSLPLEPGRDFRGTIRLPKGFPQGGSQMVDLQLRCDRIIAERTSNGTRVHSEEVWKEEWQSPAHTMSSIGGTTIPIDVLLPPDLPSTGKESDSITVTWQLQARADLPGVDFKLDFELPVFDRGSRGF